MQQYQLHHIKPLFPSPSSTTTFSAATPLFTP